MQIIVEDSIKAIAPNYAVRVVTSKVRNSETSAELWAEIQLAAENIQHTYNTSTIKEQKGIQATRQAYKAAGKDPSRYRPSCEQLCRRILQGKGLYSIDSLVDIGNLLSITFGLSVAVLDKSRLQGGEISLGIGKETEPYEAIGRGQLNISDLPVWRDNLGAFATPTSDSVRTMCSETTTEILIIINSFDGDGKALDDASAYLHELLDKYAQCSEFKIEI